jgi:hypothetical protein
VKDKIAQLARPDAELKQELEAQGFKWHSLRADAESASMEELEAAGEIFDRIAGEQPELLLEGVPVARIAGISTINTPALSLADLMGRPDEVISFEVEYPKQDLRRLLSFELEFENCMKPVIHDWKRRCWPSPGGARWCQHLERLQELIGSSPIGKLSLSSTEENS